MITVLRFLLWLPLVYLAASLAAGFTIYGAWLATDAIPDNTEFELVFGGLFTAMVFGGVAFVPSLIMIVIAEIFRLRSLIPYLIMGLLNGLVMTLLPYGERLTDGLIEPAIVSLPAGYEVYLAGGAAWGFIWWLLAGHAAGAGVE